MAAGEKFPSRHIDLVNDTDTSEVGIGIEPGKRLPDSITAELAFVWQR